jgi:hypothetical protein
MDLDFDIHLGGRAPKSVEAEVVRELRESDLALLSVERGIAPSHVQRISSRHHALARSLATGMSALEASLVCGYTPSRISVLRSDPAFEELVAHYTKLSSEATVDLQQRMATLAVEAADVMADRLETAPETFANGELHDLLKLAADRTGHGPASKTTNVNVNVNLGDRLRAARERAAVPSCLPSGAIEGGSLSVEGPPSLSGQGARGKGHAGPIIDGTCTEVRR